MGDIKLEENKGTSSQVSMTTFQILPGPNLDQG